ncbi:MAG: SusC/RagA family TonB-linked outer membrane protein [Bacteroidaceae bacterium]|nr:SusC/RagA family TonB-linked outer membrane protein [Bacteroidaceae bacterium]
MKKIISNNLLGKLFGLGLSLFFLAGTTPLYAQDDVTDVEEEVEEQEEVMIKRPAVVKTPTYEMREVKGTVIDAATRKPLAGVRVQSLNDPRYSAMTEEDGKYTVSVPVFTTTLYISTPEYNPVQIPVRDEEQTTSIYSSVFNSFYKDANQVFTKAEATWSNSSAISVESDIENALNASVFTTMRGGMPGQGAYMLINGLTSLNTSAQPLIVVDGVIWDAQYDRSAIHQGFFNNVLSTIDPEDIDKVRVVNTGTALYGAKGANGVIEITTKRAKDRATRINVRLYGGFETRPNTIDMLDGKQYRTYMSDILGTYEPSNGSSVTSALQNIASQPFMNEDPAYTYYDMYHNNTDWQKGLYQNAFTQNYRINVQGGDDIALYGLSLGYTESDATAKKNDFSRLNVRFNTDIIFSSKIDASCDISYGRVTYNLRDNGWAMDYSSNNISSPNVLGLIASPMISKTDYFIYWDDVAKANKIAPNPNVYSGKSFTDSYNPFRFCVNYGTDATANPYWILRNGQGDNKNFQEQSQFSLNFNPRYQINPYLQLGDRFSYIVNRTSEMYYLPYDGTPLKYAEGIGQISSAVKTQYGDESTVFNNLYLSFDRKFAAHSVKATAGFRLASYAFSNSFITGYNNSNDKMPNISYSLSYLTYGGTNDKWLNLAYYLDAAYNYKNKYYVNGTLTAESSSRFGKSTKEGVKLFGVNWGLFPSLQAAWLVSSESWFNVPAVNFLKVAAGYEESGNDNIDYYASRTYFANMKYLNRMTSLNLANIANSKIQWETTRRFNLGLETSLFNNRLGLGVNFFWSKTSNLLAKVNLDYLAGLPFMWANSGSMTNKGFDINANMILLNTKNFKWKAGFSLGHYCNEISSLPSSTITTYNLNEMGVKTDVYKTIQGYTSSIYGNNNVLTAVGKSAGVFYGYKTKGVFATDAEAAEAGKYGYLRYPTGYAGDPYRNFKAGDVHFVDQNGDGWISDADMVEIGNPNPDLYGNIFTSLNWKHFTLDVIFKYSLGNDVFNYQRSQLEAASNLWNQTAAIANRWTYSGQKTDIPRAVLTSSSEWVNNERFSDRWIENGSFLKLKNIRLTYNLPLSLSWLQGLAVWAEANNLVTFSKYTGSDPEFSVGNGTLYQGIDAGMLPSSRNFNFGVTINL